MNPVVPLQVQAARYFLPPHTNTDESPFDLYGIESQFNRYANRIQHSTVNAKTYAK